MAVDFKIRKFSGCRAASMTYVGPYREGGDMLKDEFDLVKKWAREERVRTGRWFFADLDGPEVPGRHRRWLAAIEVKGRSGKLRGGIG